MTFLKQHCYVCEDLHYPEFPILIKIREAQIMNYFNSWFLEKEQDIYKQEKNGFWERNRFDKQLLF